MPDRSRLLVFVLCLIALGLTASARAADQPPLPRVADGWRIELVAQAPTIQYPTAVVVAPDGSTYLGQDPMDMPGPVTEPIDSVLLIRPDGSTRIFAERLQSVMGLEWIDGTLYVVHAPFLSSFRDTNGDGRADERVDLVTGLGPAVPAATGLNDHIASGVRLGMDGFLYIAVGDKGIPRAVGRDGRAITLSSGGVVRVRPDGTDLEVVSSGERNPLSVALNDRGEVFTFGNDDDSHLWPNSLTHHIVGGHYGYPWEFRAAPHRALPIVAGQTGGAGAQGIALVDDGLPPRWRNSLVFCDWGAQSVARYEVEPQGGSHRLVRRSTIVEAGSLADFRPFSIAPTAEAGTFLVVDWAFSGWLGDGPPTGRLFRLTYTGPDKAEPRSRVVGSDLPSQIAALSHPAHAVRLATQRRLAGQGDAAVSPLIALLADSKGAETARIHALWALDAIRTLAAHDAIWRALGDPSPAVRAQAARSVGLRPANAAEAKLVACLADTNAVVRREAAIALGRLPRLLPGTRAALFAHLGDADSTVAWSIRRSIRLTADLPANIDSSRRAGGVNPLSSLATGKRQGAVGGGQGVDTPRSPQEPAASADAALAALLTAALADPARRESALSLADGWYRPEVVRCLVAALAEVDVSVKGNDPVGRARIVAALGGLYAQVPAWSGVWFGPNPLAGPAPRATEPWDRASMDLVLNSMAKAIRDPDAAVRRQALITAVNAGAKGVSLARGLLEPGAEPDPANLQAAIGFLGNQRDSASVAALARVLADARQAEEVRLAALDALGQLVGPAALNARLSVLYDAGSPEALIARALPPLGWARLLPSNDIIGFLDHARPAVRAAALGAFPVDKPLRPSVAEAILIHTDDSSLVVRVALARAAQRHRLAGAIPWLVTQAQSDDPALKSAATHALAALADPRAIPALIASLGDRDPDLRRAAVAALVRLRDQATPELTAHAARGEFSGLSALAVERILATWQPITAWRVIGPFPRVTGPIFADARAIDFTRTMPGLGGQPIAWKPVAIREPSGTLGLDGLATRAAEGAGVGQTVFLVAEITSDRDRSALLLVDSTNPATVVVDDKPLARWETGVAAEAVRIPLHSGTNRLLIRTRSTDGLGTVRVGLSDPSSTVLPGSGPVVAGSNVVREGLRAGALRMAGDPRNGAAIFHESAGVGCARCHAAGGEPAANPGLGPDLDGLARKYDKAEIIRSILEPSSRIAVGSAAVVVERRDGTTVTGLHRGETPAAVEILTAEGRVVAIPRDSISRQATSPSSIMPEGLVDGLKPTEFADLVAYLMSLTAPPSRAGSAN